jgi:hypothetical protein
MIDRVSDQSSCLTAQSALGRLVAIMVSAANSILAPLSGMFVVTISMLPR